MYRTSATYRCHDIFLYHIKILMIISFLLLFYYLSHCYLSYVVITNPIICPYPVLPFSNTPSASFLFVSLSPVLFSSIFLSPPSFFLYLLSPKPAALPLLTFYSFALSIKQLISPSSFTSSISLLFFCLSLLLSGGLELDSSDEDEDEDADRLFHLRPVTSADFSQAIKKLKASVDDNGKELMKVTKGLTHSTTDWLTNWLTYWLTGQMSE